LAEEVSYLQEKVNLLETENENLQRNMGTLYRTAVAELARKDAEITRLQQEIADRS
jgi:cell division protein FtsB